MWKFRLIVAKRQRLCWFRWQHFRAQMVHPGGGGERLRSATVSPRGYGWLAIRNRNCCKLSEPWCFLQQTSALYHWRKGASERVYALLIWKWISSFELGSEPKETLTSFKGIEWTHWTLFSQRWPVYLEVNAVSHVWGCINGAPRARSHKHLELSSI